MFTLKVESFRTEVIDSASLELQSEQIIREARGCNVQRFYRGLMTALQPDYRTRTVKVNALQFEPLADSDHAAACN